MAVPMALFRMTQNGMWRELDGLLFHSVTIDELFML